MVDFGFTRQIVEKVNAALLQQLDADALLGLLQRWRHKLAFVFHTQHMPDITHPYGAAVMAPLSKLTITLDTAGTIWLGNIQSSKPSLSLLASVEFSLASLAKDAPVRTDAMAALAWASVAKTA